VTEKEYDIWDNRFSSLVREQMEGGFGSPLDYNEANGDPSTDPGLVKGVISPRSSWLDSPPPGIAPDSSKKAFYPLQIDTADEFGEEYSQQIRKLLSDNGIDGSYIGYTMSAKDRLIDLITTRAILTVTFTLEPRAVKTVYR
jgi:hypothetical protein